MHTLTTKVFRSPDWTARGTVSTLDRRRPAVSCALAGIATLAVLLSGCTASPDHTDNVAQQDITFTVDGTGTADITWSGATGGTASQAALPWHTTIHEPTTGAHPVSVNVVLGQHGAQATCAITIAGHRVSSSLARGPYGRATCHTPTTAGSALQPDA